MTPVDHGIGIRDCEADVCENILSLQLFHLDATNWDLKFFVSICTIRIAILSFIALNYIQ